MKQRRVHHRAVQHHAPVQVRSRHAAGRAHGAQALAGGQGVAHLHVDGTQVAHHAQQAAAVIQPDGLAVEEIVARVDHPPRQGRHHRRAGGRGDVHAAVRGAGLAVEDAPQPEGAGAASGHWHAQVQVCLAGEGLAEGLHHLLLVRALALMAREVLRGEVHRARRHRQALLHIALGPDVIAQRAFAICCAQHDLRRARRGRQRDADDGGPSIGVAQHQHRHLCDKRLRARRRRPQGQARNAAGHRRGDGPGGRGGIRRLGGLCGLGGAGVQHGRQRARGGQQGGAAGEGERPGVHHSDCR
jgi:hypothetical protein